ncbi:MAG: SRPBCC family protein [Planctomycetota bacterium]
MSTPETTTQVSRVVINAPIQKVWDTLTNQGDVLPFFFGTIMHTTRLAPGAPVRMRSPNGKYTGVVGDVIELDPPYKYSMTFKFTNFDDAVCMVIHELKEVEGGTEYTLTSKDIPVGTKTEKNMKQGGTFITNELKYNVETGKATTMAKFIMFMGKMTGFLSPKSSLSSNWPMDRKVELGQ